MIKFCVQCGREFEAHHGLETLCSDECRYKRHRKRSRLYEKYVDRESCVRRLIDYLARLEKEYGALPNGRIKRMILDWREEK